MKPHESHRRNAERSLSVRIVTVSTSRYAKKEEGESYTDEAGEVAASEVKKAGHEVSYRRLVSDDRAMIRREVKGFLSGDEDVLLLAGGTGLSPRDITVETVRPFFEKELEGFGELVRRLGYDDIGSAAALTRATAGVAKGKLMICIPGSPGGVKTALKAFVGEFPHILYIAKG
jgi:molybdenum cofactor biosynthesis protein B